MVRQVRQQIDFQLPNNTVLGQQAGVVLPIPVLDEDNMISNSDISLATQQSIKAYVDLSVTGALIPQGVWNADTNTPTLVSSVGTLGHLYVVDVGGSTNLNGNTTRGAGDLLFFANGVWNRVPNTIALTRGTIGGTLSDQTDLQTALDGKANTVHTHEISDVTGLQTALDLKANNQSASSVSTTITLAQDTMHGTYASPLTGNLTISLAGGVRGVVCTIRHQQGTAPIITGGVLHSGAYQPSVMNMIQVIFDGSQAIYTISPFNA